MVDKRYFSISEVAEMCSLKPHVLRYWEREFPTLSPTKRTGNRRYYKVADIEIIRKIRSLLYDRGFTIHGARDILASKASYSECISLNEKITSAPALSVIKSELVAALLLLNGKA